MLPKPNSSSFSPILLAGIASKYVPEPVVEFALKNIIRKVADNHPGVLERLSPVYGKIFQFEPAEFPKPIQVIFFDGRIDAELIGTENDQCPDVRISGSFTALLSLLEGTEDGDALFFSRQIVVQGDTEALLTLRNALDSEDIELWDDLTSGALQKPVMLMGQAGSGLFRNISADMDKMNQALIMPVINTLKSHSHQIETIDGQLKDINAELARLKRQVKQTRRKENP